ncbi:hypothetical protein L5179_004620 [Vibrio parahaemolyticus]|nr:hypothetical protein [Vibrio parahaemolyticus]EJG1294696.1 hypothetical protein [Vibrio parahaemolyticus]
MVKALKIEENLYINMDTIVEFYVEKDALRITTNAHPELAYYQIAQQGSKAYGEIFVPVNELHRIKRELGHFMGVELHVDKECEAIDPEVAETEVEE